MCPLLNVSLAFVLYFSKRLFTDLFLYYIFKDINYVLNVKEVLTYEKHFNVRMERYCMSQDIDIKCVFVMQCNLCILKNVSKISWCFSQLLLEKITSDSGATEIK